MARRGPDRRRDWGPGGTRGAAVPHVHAGVSICDSCDLMWLIRPANGMDPSLQQVFTHAMQSRSHNCSHNRSQSLHAGAA